jgi:hypothetical protein
VKNFLLSPLAFLLFSKALNLVTTWISVANLQQLCQKYSATTTNVLAKLNGICYHKMMWGRFGFDWMLEGLLHVEVDQLAS